MPSSYTSNLRLTLPVTGELAGLWGDTVNTGITQLLDSAISGTVSIDPGDANHTLTVTSGAADQARFMFITMTGALTADRNVICPDNSKQYFVTNNTTGGFAITIKTSAGTGVKIPPGKRAAVYCDGTNVLEAITYMTSGGGGATGGFNNPFLFENDTNVTTDYTITTGKNAMSAGPITVDSGVVVTIPSGSVYTIV